MKRMINLKPARALNLMLGLLPFALLLILYVVSSDARLELNPSDKLLPSLEQIGSAIERMAPAIDLFKAQYRLE